MPMVENNVLIQDRLSYNNLHCPYNCNTILLQLKL